MWPSGFSPRSGDQFHFLIHLLLRVIQAQELCLPVPGMFIYSINNYCLLKLHQALRIQAKSLFSWSLHSSGGYVNQDKLGYAVEQKNSGVSEA